MAQRHYRDPGAALTRLILPHELSASPEHVYNFRGPSSQSKNPLVTVNWIAYEVNRRQLLDPNRYRPGSFFPRIQWQLRGIRTGGC